MNSLEKLYYSQLKEFELAQKNFANLEKVEYRTISLGDFSFVAQYNPERINSTAAKIDPETLQKRKCFLCSFNMPEQQKGIPYEERYNIYVNPYPIFNRHFTIPDRSHSPQLISGRYPDMLSLAKDFQQYVIFYNGPQCGASAPDHFHFQLAGKGIMPLEKDIQTAFSLLQKDNYSVRTIDNYLRKVIILESSNALLLSSLFNHILNLLNHIEKHEPEAMVNVLTYYENNRWITTIFPRRALRPRQFFAEGDEKILFSPGCVDFAGFLVTPRKVDFDRYTPEILADLFGQLTLTDDCWHRFLSLLPDYFSE